jgi:hypothetical protein
VGISIPGAKQTMKKILSFTLCFFLLAGMLTAISPLDPSVSPALAQSSDQRTPTATPASAEALPAADAAITFGQLGMTDTFLYGPYDTLVINYNLPSDWKLDKAATLQLTLTPSFTPGTAAASDKATPYSGGVLYISINGDDMYQIGLSWTGEQTYTFTLPIASLASTRQDGRQEIRFFLNAGTDCEDDGRTDVLIKASSSITLPHSYAAPSTSLSALPKPIYLRTSFAPVPAVVVIPDQPTAGELQAALTTFAGFGHLTQGNLALTMLEAGQVTDETLQTSNLIFVGKAAGLPQLKSVDLPAASSGTDFAADKANADDGIVEMAVSPWNKSNVVLVIGGNSDLGVIKAAQAVSSGTLRPGIASNLTYVADVMDSIDTAATAVDRTLADLGYTSIMLNGIGLQSADVNFTVPAGQVASADSYFTLVYNHSGLLDINSSGLSVYLNGETIGSQSLSGETSSNTSIQISIPSDLVKQGVNTLTLEANLDPADNCSLFAQDNLWVSMSSSSLLHLPLEAAVTVTSPTSNLRNYPYPFIAAPTLKSTTFVLAADAPESWAAAAKIAGDLGYRSSGALTELGVVFGDAVTDEIRQTQDLLIVGQASSLPIISELQADLPAPFENGSDIATERAFRVVYNLPAGTTIGYLELLASPWQADRTIVAALGSTTDGVNMAANALTTSALRSQLGGDFAVVNGSQVLTSDSRLQVGTGNISATIVPVEATPVTVSTQIIQSTIVPDSRPAWLQPTILITGSLVLITLIGLGVAVFTRRKL